MHLHLAVLCAAQIATARIVRPFWNRAVWFIDRISTCFCMIFLHLSDYIQSPSEIPSNESEQKTVHPLHLYMRHSVKWTNFTLAVSRGPSHGRVEATLLVFRDFALEDWIKISAVRSGRVYPESFLYSPSMGNRLFIPCCPVRLKMSVKCVFFLRFLL